MITLVKHVFMFIDNTEHCRIFSKAKIELQEIGKISQLIIISQCNKLDAFLNQHKKLVVITIDDHEKLSWIC